MCHQTKIADHHTYVNKNKREVYIWSLLCDNPETEGKRKAPGSCEQESQGPRKVRKESQGPRKVRKESQGPRKVRNIGDLLERPPFE
jgi:hypothetical protein